MKKNYDDIISLPHPTSPTHPRMSLLNRAAQFAPFAALTGFEEAILETARPTQEKIEISETSRAVIDAALHEVMERNKAYEAPLATLTYFRPDDRKEGGMYETINARIRRVDPVTRKLFLAGGDELDVESLYSVEIHAQEGPDPAMFPDGPDESVLL